MYIARQPILNANLDVYGYELLYRDTIDAVCFNSISSIKATASEIESLFESGIENIVGKHAAFINFDHSILENSLIDLLDKSKVVLEILESTEINDDLLSKLIELSRSGFRVALDDVEDNSRAHELMDYAQIIKVDLTLVRLEEIKPMVTKFIQSGKVLLAEKVETEAEFIMAKKYGVSSFSRIFFQ